MSDIETKMVAADSDDLVLEVPGEGFAVRYYIRPGLLKQLKRHGGALVLEVAGARVEVRPLRRCSRCGCTDGDCSRCIERTGARCHWVAPELCSACE